MRSRESASHWKRRWRNTWNSTRRTSASGAIIRKPWDSFGTGRGRPVPFRPVPTDRLIKLLKKRNCTSKSCLETSSSNDIEYGSSEEYIHCEGKVELQKAGKHRYPEAAGKGRRECASKRNAYRRPERKDHGIRARGKSS